MSDFTRQPVTAPKKHRPKVALVHYWLLTMRGGEKVLEAVLGLFPDADIYTHVYDPKNPLPFLQGKTPRTTFIQKLPFARKHYQKYLPLMPMALEQLDLRGYDLVISFESGPAKGVITGPETTHICYCHSPMRYIWDCYHDYLERAGLLSRLGMRIFSRGLRMWDYTSAAGVDHFIANSHYIAGRVRKFYGRESAVIYPPVELEAFRPGLEPRGDFYLCYGQLTPYKRIDLAVEAFKRNGKRLIVAGDGEELPRLQAMATPNITFVGRQDNASVLRYLQSARALVFPGKEDFGIIPVEAMACGCPVLAFGQGGALETVREGASGMFFTEQTVESLDDCIRKFEENAQDFPAQKVAQCAEQFGKARFLQEMREFITTRSGFEIS